MRRLLSLVLSIGTLASGLGVALASPASAASGDVTITRSATVAPSAVPNAQILRLIRLEKENAFLAVGRDANTEGSTLHVWKIKGDLSLDTSFPTVNLGEKFAQPTSTNSSCTGFCTNLTLNINETVGTYVVTFERFNMKGTSQFSSAPIRSFAIGSLKTGTVIAQTATVLGSAGSNFDISPWAEYATTRLAREVCVNGTGTAIQGLDLSDAYFDSSSVYVRPDNSLIFTLRCNYNTNTGMMNANWVEYTTIVAFALKPQGSDLALDTSFGSNGYVVLFNDPTKCAASSSSQSYDTTIPSLTSEKLSHIRLLREYARVTTIPSYLQSGNLASYNGCAQEQNTVFTQTVAKTFLINGGVKSTAAVGNGGLSIGRYVIDSTGRWSGITSSINGQNVTYKMVRFLSNGETDPKNGTNGVKDLTGLPSTITVDGTSVRMNYNLNGIAFTATSTLFAGFSSSRSSSTCDMNPANNTGTITTSQYPYYFDDVNGLLKSYGTDGLGDAFTYVENKADSCSGRGATGATFIDSKGRPAALFVLPAVGLQQAGLTLAVWDVAEGVVGGGEGVGELAASGGRTDTKVYSRKLPVATQVETSLRVLTRKAQTTERLISRTPRVCTVANGIVLMLRKGTCTVNVVNKATGNTVRTLSTNVKDDNVDVGSSLTANDPVMFKQGSSRLSKKTRAQVKELAETAKDAKAIYVIGHSAQLFAEDSPFNYAISRNRARNVADLIQAELKKTKVKVPVIIIAEGSRAQLSLKKTEKVQSQNRRVEVYFG